MIKRQSRRPTSKITINSNASMTTTTMDQPRPQGAFPCKAREKRPGDEVDNGQ